MVFFKSEAAVFGTLLLSSIQPCIALPASPGFSPNYSNDALVQRADPQDFYLRIMPLGASITAGEEADPEDKEHNGYRKFLRDALRFDGWKVNMVGNQNSGSMKDNDHEGVSGDTVAEVGDRAKQASYVWLPNVILINAGTNDAEGDDVSGVGAAMRETIDAIFSEVPSALIILSTLLPSEEYQDNVDDINKQYRTVANAYNNARGDDDPTFKVILADMVSGDFITTKDLHDGKHPTVDGYKKMASVWRWAVNQANEKGWLSEPSDSGRFTDGEGQQCRKRYGSGELDQRSGRQILYAGSEVIADDGGYKHKGTYREDVGGMANGDADDIKILFAEIVSPPGQDAPVKGKERDEFIWVEGNKDDRKVKYWLNNGAGTFGDEEEIDVKDECSTAGFFFGDVDGDALDDFICIAEDGEMFVSMNRGGSPPEFESIGSFKTPEKELGRKNVRLGDIDGDGRIDYCVIEPEGDIYCWRNDPEEWQDMGAGQPIFTAKGMGDIAGVEFVDLNGDGRYDWTWTSNKGEVTTWINQRGADKNMIPAWLDAGVTHAAFDKKFDNYGEGVVWGRILNDEKTDYIHHEIYGCTGLNNPRCDVEWKAYENQGSGGRYQKGDGIFFGDITGTGVDDYVWISPEGMVNVFLNKNTANDTDDYETSAWGGMHTLDTRLSRRGLHLGDWDGDGKADVIGVTDKETGALKVWYSRWNDNTLDWEEEEVEDSDKCDQGWGRRYYDSGIHFADITGSGRVDYLCMASDGATTAWTRDDDGWTDAGEIRAADNIDRALCKWADADGDGKADLIWTDPFNGDGWVYYNEGDGTEFEWAVSEKVFQGSSQGPNMLFPVLGGQGRADMVGTEPATGYAWIWFNACPAGGDDPVVTGTSTTDPSSRKQKVSPGSGSGDTGDNSGTGDDGAGQGNLENGGDESAEDDGEIEDPGLPEFSPDTSSGSNIDSDNDQGNDRGDEGAEDVGDLEGDEGETATPTETDAAVVGSATAEVEDDGSSEGTEGAENTENVERT